MLKQWEDLPDFMRTQEVRLYWEKLYRKRGQLLLKRLFDFILALFLTILFSIPMLIIAVWVRTDSEGPVFFRQVRVTAYGREFHIYKFRTMVVNADKIGSSVTVSGDSRITRSGRILRHSRLDELPQLINVLEGTMTFVGTRPEVPMYVRHYTAEMYATLLLPAGITSETSIRFRNEEDLFAGDEDRDRIYIEKILPEKMKWNLRSLENFGLWNDLKTIFRTAGVMVS